MNRREYIIGLLDELIKLFINNDVIFQKLIRHRHYVKNVCSDEDIDNEITKFDLDAVKNHDIQAFKNAPYFSDMLTVWECIDNKKNRENTWKWVHKITGR